MKPWLLEILACPIDKHYPLEVDILKIEDESTSIEHYGIEDAMKRDLQAFFLQPGNEIDENGDSLNDIINVEEIDGNIFAYDTLVRKPAPLTDYLEKIKESIDELIPITNHTGEQVGKMLTENKDLRDQVDSLREKTINLDGKKDEIKNLFSAITGNLLRLNWFKQHVEIESGIMFCSKCNRWYPIKETIPQMLPDELRKKNEDLVFLKEWEELVDDKITRNGEPFHL